jgi:hypothetical protein
LARRDGPARNEGSERAKAMESASREFICEVSSRLEANRDWTKDPLVRGQQLTAFGSVDSRGITTPRRPLAADSEVSRLSAECLFLLFFLCRALQHA